jgi:N-acetylglucosaminyl-diphospho-decaprenol L-rhamnosyltransferase
VRPLISIIIVNSDGAEDTLRCLESIERNPPDAQALGWSGELLETVLVDNCSADGCLETVAQRFPSTRRLRAPVRQGFAKNYNQGIWAARGAYVLVLNNDTLVHARALTKLLLAMQNQPGLGVAGPRLVSADGGIQIDCARDLPRPWWYALDQLLLDQAFPLGRLWARRLRWRLARRASGSVPCISGACMLLRREAVEQAGLLDEGFVFYYEDVEWCHRLGASGWQVGYVADATVTHLGDQSLSRVKVWAKRSELESAMRYFRRYHGLSAADERRLRKLTTISWLLRGIVFLLIEGLLGRVGHARAYLLLCAKPRRASAGAAERHQGC